MVSENRYRNNILNIGDNQSHNIDLPRLVDSPQSSEKVYSSSLSFVDNGSKDSVNKPVHFGS